MATLTRTNSRNLTAYKDYVNFLDGYKTGKRDDENSDSGVSVNQFSLSNSSNSTSSSSISSDVTDFPKNTCTPYNTYLQNSKNKKFNPVKPNLEEKEKEKPPTKKSEIYIEIQPTKSVSEVSKMFESKQERKSPPRSSSINSKINLFEKQISTENKPKIANKPPLNKISLPPKTATPPPPPETETLPPPPPEFLTPESEPSQESQNIPPPPPSPTVNQTTTLPPPPPPVNKLQATLTKGPQTKFSVTNPNGTVPNEIDRNDPLVRKLVYGTLRGLYGAYHDKATNMLSTMPKNMVVRSNGVQDRIEQIASNGDLEKLNGRVNPKSEQE